MSRTTLKTVFFTALSTIPGYVANDGALLQGAVVQDAEQLAPRLLDIVFNTPELRGAFAVSHGEHYVLDKAKLLTFLTSKDYLPDSFTAFSNKIGLTSEGRYLSYNRDVVLDFPYKDAVLVGNQSHEEQKGVAEKFYNEVLAADEIDRLFEPKVLCKFVRHAVSGATAMAADDAIDVGKDNLIIHGNNLLALHSLKARFAGRVKLIYIDVPYNTGSDSFAYNDKFNVSTYLTFMKNRLAVANLLLAKGGVVCIQISNKHAAKLECLADEIFETKYPKIAVKTSASQGGFGEVNPGLLAYTEYILIYGKGEVRWNQENMYVPREYDEAYSKVILNPEADYASWRYTNISYLAYEELGLPTPYDNQTWRQAEKLFGPRYKQMLAEKKAEIAMRMKSQVFQTANPNKPSESLKAVLAESRSKPDCFVAQTDCAEPRYCLNGRLVLFYSNTFREVEGELVPSRILSTIWSDIAWEGIAGEGNVTLKNGKKPEALLHRLIGITTEPGDLVLDFFLGSGTTAAVAHKMGRRYIGIEQLDYGDDGARKRLINVINGDASGVSGRQSVAWKGGGSFIYIELLSQAELLVTKIQAADQTTIGGVVELVSGSAVYLDYRFRPEVLASAAFNSLELSQKKEVLLLAINKTSLYVGYSDIEDAALPLSDNEKALNHKFYGGK